MKVPLKVPPSSRLRRLANPSKWASALFWSWNGIFLAFMFLGFAPQILPEMLNVVRSGGMPAAFLGYAVILTAIPAVALIVGYALLRQSPARLFALGYGIEGPLMILLAVRFFLVRQMTPGVAILLGTALLGMAVFLWQLFDRRIDGRNPILAHARMIGLTLLLIVGVYASIWVAFYAVPLAAQSGEIMSDLVRQIWRSLREFNLRELLLRWRWIPFWLLWVPLLIYSATLFVLMPIAVSILYGRAWWRSLRALLASYSRPRAVALTTAVVALFAVIFIQGNKQPQQTAFALLATPPTTPAEAQALHNQEGIIRDGLLNAYLAPQRYIFAKGEVRHISAIYEQALDMKPTEARQVQSLYEAVAQPLLYKPVNERATVAINVRGTHPLQAEPIEAAELYEAYFDEPIIDGEHEIVADALRATWIVDQARAGWQAVEDREVYLQQQALTIKEHGDWADVELYEVYQNQTSQRQEVVYYFTLPESAVITGVWLGDSPERSERFAYQVAPRGAAQAVYRNEVRRSIDPALVEQIGPSQYRLRVFPIPPQTWQRDDAWSNSTIEEAPYLHLWLTWQVMADENTWPLPYLAEKRNVYWDGATERSINGESLVDDVDAWLPEAVPAASPATPQTHRFDFPNGQSVIARPVLEYGLPEMAGNLKLAAVVDRSRSIEAYSDEIQAALQQLEQMAATVDVYLTASDFLGEPPSLVALAELDLTEMSYGGGQNAAELLAQFGGLVQNRKYDAVFVLTDGSGYKLDDSGIDVPIPDSPVWMIHLGGDFPLGYDDATLEAIQASGGGVSGNVTEAATRLSMALESSAEGTEAGVTKDVLDGYVWLTMPTEAIETISAELAAAEVESAFGPIAARRYILSEMVRHRDSLNALETLDQLHAIAIDQSIVTPYSSMIVLVEQRQQRLLDQLEARGDRFEREYEDVGETTGLTVTGVPEPEEWLLLALVAAMLIWYGQTTRRQRPAAAA